MKFRYAFFAGFIAFLSILVILPAPVKDYAATTTNVAETIKFQAPSSTTQYYVYAWDSAGTLDNGSKTGFTAIPKTPSNGVETLVLNVPSNVSSFSFFITDGNNWANNPNKIVGTGNGLTVASKGKALTSYVTSRGYGISEATTTNASLQLAAFATADEYQAAQINDFSAFDLQWGYEGTDLGFNYSTKSTSFKLWAPTATSVQLVSYGTNTSPTAGVKTTYTMTRGNVSSPNKHTTNTVGTWTYTLTGNQTGLVYQYKVTFADGTISDYAVGTAGEPTYGTLNTASVTNTTNDPYSIATTQGGLRSVVESPAAMASNLSVKQGSAASWRVASPTQAIVDELHIREFTISSTSGVSAANRGKYLGVIQANTKDPNTGSTTGLSYLKNEGFNYIQLMPTSQYASVSETGTVTSAFPNNFNWGYDPENEMVPEGEYASNSVNPLTRITEMKQMVQGLHTNGIGVVMDMVLNHVYSQSDSPFEKAEPGYYFRKYTQSGCGNDTASNHEMFGKFIIDSVTYWAKNYDIDGFRFDEMSLLDTTTMNKLRAALTALDPHIIMYGEGWGATSDNFTPTQTSNWAQVPGIGFFNAGERDAISNNKGEAGGLVSGNTAATVSVADGLLGSGGWNGTPALESFLTPSQSANYVECHDSYTLSDQIWSSNPKDTIATHDSRDELANAINLMADGITFMETGQEFDQTKLVNPTTLTSLSATQIQSYQNGTTPAPAWYSASWATAANSYNGLFGKDLSGNYYGNYWPGSNLYTPVVAGDVVNAMNWDNVASNQSAVNFIASLMKFKKANPQFWPNDYSKLAWTPTSTGVENVTNATSGVITEELTSGTTKYLVIFNASGNSVTIGQGGSFYGSSDLAGKNLITTSDSTLSSLTGQALTTSSVTVSNLTATVIKLSK
ncbi:MAG: hypothetical protein LBI43_05750 [Streptococcaceae bacterium]|jgi:type I pullulanase|nr:hypothetical protein [Streptococcaceae bacterium]